MLLFQLSEYIPINHYKTISMQKNFFPTLVTVCIIAHMVRTAYEVLKHKKVITASRLSFIIVFTDMLLLWASWFALNPLDPSRTDLPCIIRYFGIFFILAGVVVFFISLFTIKTLENHKGDLITHGIYSRVRHPMYLGFIFWLLGMSLFHGGIISLVLCIVFIANVLFWRYLEEKELEERFPEYKNYKTKTLF